MQYKGTVLWKGSKALELHNMWTSAKTEELKKVAKKLLDAHVKDVETRYKELLERYQ